jgi:hypothetical protein
MTESDMQKAWYLIKKKAFNPIKKEQDKWINTLNRFCTIKIGGIPNINQKKVVDCLDFKLIRLEPRISDKPTIRIASSIPERISEINLHYDPMYKVEFPKPDILKAKNLGKVFKDQNEIIEVLRNYIAHPAIHIHIPEPELKMLDEADEFHEIRIAVGTNNFFYLMYQTFFQTLDYTNRYGNSVDKRREIERLANVLWENRKDIHPIAPGILFPIGK